MSWTPETLSESNCTHLQTNPCSNIASKIKWSLRGIREKTFWPLESSKHKDDGCDGWSSIIWATGHLCRSSSGWLPRPNHLQLRHQRLPFNNKIRIVMPNIGYCTIMEFLVQLCFICSFSNHLEAFQIQEVLMHYNQRLLSLQPLPSTQSLSPRSLPSISSLW